MKTNHTKTFHFVTHTHWDREWYFTFEQFRMILVDLIDELIAIFNEDPEYKYFHLDGQTIVLEDYLEIRPHHFDKLAELVKQQKIFIGPWYVLPDEFLVSGEALIRNLLRGHTIGNKFGRVMKVGYTPDSFGHISQLPQIMQGFGIDNVVLWRGFGGEPGQKFSEYNWHSPDGSKVIMIHLPPFGYSDKNLLTTVTEQEILEKWNELHTILVSRGITNHYLSLQGADHRFPCRNIVHVLDVLRKNYDDNFLFSNVADYLSEIRNDQHRFPDISGEHRSGYRYTQVLQGVYSTRMYLKQMNERCQTLAEKYAEPLNALAKILTKVNHQPFIEQAWKYLLQNHPHDSICGCSIDAVHHEMVTRFEKCEQLLHNVISQLMIDLTQPNEGDERTDILYVFNPSPYERSEVVYCEIDLPVEVTPEAPLDSGNSHVQLFDATDKIIPYQLLTQRNCIKQTYVTDDFLKQEKVRRLSLLIDAHHLPPLGLKSYKIQCTDDMSVHENLVNGLTVGRYYLENRFVRVDVSNKGQVQIFDKERHRTYKNFNIFEDSADVGDEYNYSYPLQDRLYKSTQFKPRLSVIENGPLRGAIRIRTRMKIPQMITKEMTSRSDKKIILKLSSVVYLEYNSPIVYFQTTIINNAQNHRLRVLFDTYVRTNESYAESAFHVIRRTHQKIGNLEEYRIEFPSQTHPMQRFVAVVDAEKGVTLITKGLPEYELVQNGQSTLALTLLRCIGRLSGDNLITRPCGNVGPDIDTPEAQCPGTHIFNYAIVCHGPDIQNELPHIFDAVDWHNVKPLWIQQDSNSSQNSLDTQVMIIENKQIRLSALKVSEDDDGIIVRCFNASDSDNSTLLKFNCALKKAYLTNLKEEILSEMIISSDNELLLQFKPWEIISLKLQC